MKRRRNKKRIGNKWYIDWDFERKNPGGIKEEEMDGGFMRRKL